MRRSRNLFINSRRFLSTAAWVDRTGAFVLWPACWWDAGREVGMAVRLSRVCLAWGRWRLEIDVGTYLPRSARRSLDWGGDGLDAFLLWGRQVFGGSVWTRAGLEDLLREDPAWYRLIALGGPPSYYTKVLLARELIQRATASPATTVLPLFTDNQGSAQDGLG